MPSGMVRCTLERPQRTYRSCSVALSSSPVFISLQCSPVTEANYSAHQLTLSHKRAPWFHVYFVHSVIMPSVECAIGRGRDTQKFERVSHNSFASPKMVPYVLYIESVKPKLQAYFRQCWIIFTARQHIASHGSAIAIVCKSASVRLSVSSAGIVSK